MTLDVETFETTTGWTSTGTMTVSQNQITQYIALHKTASLMVNIPSNNSGKKITKTLNVPMAGMTEIVLSIWSQRKASNQYIQNADFSYSIKFGSGAEYFLPIIEGFEQVSFYVPALTTVTEFTITALTNSADVLLLSACVAVKDDYPADVLDGMRTEIQRQMVNETGLGLLLGTVSGITGDTTLPITHFPYADRMATVLIKDATHSEVHAFDLTDEINYRFASTYDGLTLKYDYTSASVYLNFPVEFGRYEQDAIIPGVFLWKMAAEPVMRSTDLDTVYDTSTTGTWQSRRVPINENYRVLIDVEARHPKILAIMNRAVKRFLGLNVLWINGRKHTFQWSVPPVEIEPDQSIEQFPKIQYEVSIEVQEERENRTGIYGGLSTENITVTPVGVLP